MAAEIKYKFPLFEYLRKRVYLKMVRFRKQISPNNSVGVVGSTAKPSTVVIPDDPATIIDSFLFLGSAYAVRNTNVLDYYGITHVLNVARLVPVDYSNTKVITKHIMADDTMEYNLRYNFDEAFRFIDEAKASGGRVLVHCAMGISRSAAIVIAYLMYKYRVPLNVAFDFVKARRMEINPNPGFMNQLRNFEYDLLRQNYYHSNRSNHNQQHQPQQQQQQQHLSTKHRHHQPLPKHQQNTHNQANNHHSHGSSNQKQIIENNSEQRDQQQHHKTLKRHQNHHRDGGVVFSRTVNVKHLN